MECSPLGNHLVSRETKAPPNLDWNIVNECDDTIWAGGSFQGLITRITKENEWRIVLICVPAGWGVKIWLTGIVKPPLRILKTCIRSPFARRLSRKNKFRRSSYDNHPTLGTSLDVDRWTLPNFCQSPGRLRDQAWMHYQSCERTRAE